MIKYILRRIFVRYMIKAIDVARSESFASPKSTMTNGLRVIRRFEKVNGIEFNPRDSLHISFVRRMGCHEDFFRTAKRVLRAWPIQVQVPQTQGTDMVCSGTSLQCRGDSRERPAPNA